MIDGTGMLKENIFSYLTREEQTKAKNFVAFPNAAIDRIVPNFTGEKPLDVFVEPYFEWIVEKDTHITDLPKIKGVKYVKDLKPYIERKLFTVNTGHATAAYVGKV